MNQKGNLTAVYVKRYGIANYFSKINPRSLGLAGRQDYQKPGRIKT